MDQEIKNILDIERYRNKDGYVENISLMPDEIHKLLDFITNLQEKVNQYENPDDLTLFYMWLDEKAKDKMKYLQEHCEYASKVCIAEHKYGVEKAEEARSYKSIIDKAINYNEHLIRDAKYHLNLGHLKKMDKILKGKEAVNSESKYEIQS